MIRQLLVCRSRGTDPYENLALEEALLHRVGAGELILYLWQNERTVVIGRNQNPWKECRTALLAEEGGHLARRLSGGGAVFHDRGNLNFTFLVRETDYDVSRQLSVIETACRSLGIPVERSGRNDLLADGRKFSGNAFYKHEGRCYHHGTLMVDVDTDLVQRYLSPSKAKLEAKGVDSVRARVVNLKEFVPDLTVQRLASALISALPAVYSAGEGIPAIQDLDPKVFNLGDLRAKCASDAWLYGPKLPFTLSVEERFSWGGVELQLNVNEGVIRLAKVYTDALDETLAQKLEAVLPGCPFRSDALLDALNRTDLPDLQKTDVLSLLRKVL
ncbi:MAG: lipoate--protein ligase [Candidatus Faecousia sp.]|nr:lipoate--protein ligase [Candidatus Faecousia sp.]